MAIVMIESSGQISVISIQMKAICRIRFRTETDPILAQHLINSPRNARYTSKTIQNELVEVIGNSIRNDIVDEVKKAKFYSVIADEVTDSANKEELSLALRYILDGSIKEVCGFCRSRAHHR